MIKAAIEQASARHLPIILNNMKGVVQKTLNGIAFYARDEAVKKIKEKLILRNTYTQRGIIYDKVKETNIAFMKSGYGTAAGREYMERQETGYTTDKPKPTLNVRTSKDKKKMIKRIHYMKRLNVKNYTSIKNFITLIKKLRHHSKTDPSKKGEYRAGYTLGGSAAAKININRTFITYGFSHKEREKKSNRTFRVLDPLYIYSPPRKVKGISWMAGTNDKITQGKINEIFNNAAESLL